ncbi:MAG: hypothetical protein ACLQPD_04445 [Desulfomonilaceae bacterium]
MKFDQDGPSVEPALVLRFLINKCELGKRYVFSAPLLGLAFAVLSSNEELSREFKKIVSSSSQSLEEHLAASAQIFRSALETIQDDDVDFEASTDEMSSLEPKILKRILMAAYREGKEMLNSKSFEFISIWQAFTWMGLHIDPALLKNFEQSCLLADVEPREKVEEWLEIIRDAIFGRRAEGQVQPLPN